MTIQDLRKKLVASASFQEKLSVIFTAIASMFVGIGFEISLEDKLKNVDLTEAKVGKYQGEWFVRVGKGDDIIEGRDADVRKAWLEFLQEFIKYLV